MANLERDGLIKSSALLPPEPVKIEPDLLFFFISHRQNELKEGAQRSVGRQYFYVDYKHFCDVVKWRVAEMHRVIDTGLRNVSPVQAMLHAYVL